MVSDLSAQGDNAAMFVEEDHVAVTPHELQNQYALDRFARSLCQGFQRTCLASLPRVVRPTLD